MQAPPSGIPPGSSGKERKIPLCPWLRWRITISNQTQTRFLLSKKGLDQSTSLKPYLSCLKGIPLYSSSPHTLPSWQKMYRIHIAFFSCFREIEQIEDMNFSVVSLVKNSPSVQEMEMWVQSLHWEDPLEKEMATHSSILA